VTQTTLADVPLLAPSTAARTVVVVGDRALPKSELAWCERLPLFGKRILVTRAREQGGRTAALLRARGADPVVVPTIEIGPPTDASALRNAVARFDRYAWVVFTSENGVRYTWDELRRQGKDARAFGGVKIAAIGPGTASALERIGLEADLVPKAHKGEGMAEELVARLGAAKSRVLLARAETGRDVLPAALGAIGCEVDDVAAYRTSAPPRPLLEAVAALLEAREIDAVTFTSSSTVTHLCDALSDRATELLANATVASIGPITTNTARKRGLRVDVTAEEHSLEGLVASLERFFAFSTTGVHTAIP
jgi:uroporphyrinogen III methyltransferase / synthase